MRLTREQILQYLDYDAGTAQFTYRPRPVRSGKQAAPDGTWNKRYSGRRAGWMHTHGYRVITIHAKRYYAHHLVWFLEKGVWPTQLDHINGNPDDNRIENLRECTHSQNCMNGSMWSHNTSGVKGVSRRPDGFFAYIKKNQRQISLGVHKTIEDAAEARRRAEIDMFREFRRKIY